MNKTHASYMKRTKANNNMNITRVMHMTMTKENTYNNAWGTEIDGTNQVSLRALHDK